MSQIKLPDTRRFLVVGQDQALNEVIASFLTAMDHEPHVTQSPVNTAILATTLMPEVIYTSLTFREMHGFQLCSALRQIPELRYTRIVAFTGLWLAGIQDICRAVGFDHCLLIPFTITQLADTIDKTEGDRIRQKLGC